jgi:hypothetical protein
MNGHSETELALWMLERMRGSAKFLEAIREARLAGRHDALDSVDDIEPNRQRLKALHEGDDEVPVPPAVAARVAVLVERDVLVSGEALIEAAMALYLATKERAGTPLPINQGSVLDAARDEIEGRTNGQFKAGFVAGLAAAARAELEREADLARQQGLEREG